MAIKRKNVVKENPKDFNQWQRTRTAEGYKRNMMKLKMSKRKAK